MLTQLEQKTIVEWNEKDWLSLIISFKDEINISLKFLL